MPKVATFEEVLKEFKKRGYELLETEYKNNTTPMKFRCPYHPNKENKITYKNLRKGCGCSYCAGVAKYTFSEVVGTFESRGYILLETEYINNKKNMKYKCLKHPNENLKISYGRLKRGEGCPFCAGNIKHDIEFIRSEFNNRKYELIEDEYINSKTKMKYRCPNHPEEDLYITYNDLKQGYGCKLCFEDSKRESFEEIERVFDDKGYILITDYKLYKNMNTILEYKCLFHEDKILKIKYRNLKNGGGCEYCSGRIIDIEDIRNEFECRGYVLLEDVFINKNTKMNFKCLKHPDLKQNITYRSFNDGHGCKQCGKESSISKRKGEKHSSWKGGITEITEFLRKRLREWKWSSLKIFDYKCAITGEYHTDLHIHHPKPFHQIRDEIFIELDMPIYQTIGEYTQEQLDLLVYKLKEKHNEFIGIPVRKHLHELFHSIYKYNTTYEDFYEFKQRYLNGEFKITA